MNTQPGEPQNNPTMKQYTVMEYLLEQFTDPGTHRLKAFYFIRSREYYNPSSRMGRVDDFVVHEPQAHEDYWSTEVENFLPESFAAVDGRTILGKPHLVKVLKDCVAPHWARSKAYKESHNRLLEKVTERQGREWMERLRLVLARTLCDRHGLYPLGNRALASEFHLSPVVRCRVARRCPPPSVVCSLRAVRAGWIGHRPGGGAAARSEAGGLRNGHRRPRSGHRAARSRWARDLPVRRATVVRSVASRTSPTCAGQAIASRGTRVA
jgi:hypothetical protein